MHVPSTSALFAAPPTKPSTSSFFAAPEKAKSAVEQEFLDYAKMTPGEKLRKSILNSMGLTEADLKNMDPEMRERIEQKIKDMIKMKVEAAGEEKTGMLVDIKA